MTDLIKGATPAQITDFLKSEFGEKRATRSEEKLIKYPAKGYFYKVGTTTAKIGGKEVTYPIVIIRDGTSAKAKEIGNISFSSIYRSISNGKVLQVTKKGSAYENFYMNGTMLMHDFSKNKSEAETIAYILGKEYTAEDSKQVLAVVDYDETTKVVKSICREEKDCAQYLITKDVCYITLK